ncbi:peroxisomal membrane protein PEX14-like [Condylostylus longicornis]|uniref:peroxisomal membrane protein PEX14-like n=1 Tax=Condylostylus longicornis TaxID=2530218 RepID=UPI00244DF3C8|nr:peroxisomal membrane protein PEX14-like [Condylostylus longicornis]
MSVQQMFCLRWNNHQSNFISVCSSLLHNGSLVDVTLAAEGKQLQAHKIVLSTCSSYFQALFTANPCQHPIVILKDVQYSDLKTMVDFMYYGEVNVSQEQLPHILKTAEMLKIKGLADMPTDAATLTKSESKSSDHTDHLQRSGSGSDSLWDNSESQYQEQQQQQQPQQQLSLTEEYSQRRDIRSQSPPQIRRTRSAESVSPPAARRKRLRKSPNNGSTDESCNIECKVNQFSVSREQIREKSAKEVCRTEFIREEATINEIENPKLRIQPIKPEIELPIPQHTQPTISHSRSLEITSSLSPTEQIIPSQTSNSDQPFLSNQQNLSTAAKRNRFLIRQPRIKRESDNIHQTASLDIKSTNELIEYEVGGGSGIMSHVRNQSYQETLLTVPPRIERHASEPLPVLEPSTPHLLTVPSHSSGPPFLVKQHSHPLLPSQQAQSSSFLLVHNTNESPASITRQLSHPLTLSLSTESSPTVSSIAISGSGIGRIPKNDDLDPTNLSSEITDYTGNISGGNSSAGSGNINVVPPSSLIASTATTSSVRDHQLKVSSITTSASASSFGRKKINAETPSNIVPPPITKAHSSSVISLSESFFSTSTTTSVSGVGNSGGNNSSPMRVKSEDLQRSVSSPLVLNQDPPSFECVSRSSHCPVIRPGPALGCNFCWNTIDAHGRILRRKTKYHCPECQTNLCIVPCFQEYHERQSTENTSTNSTKENSKSQSSGLKHHPKTESF